MEWLEIAILVALLLIVFCELWKPRKFPPGPYQIPLLGSVPALRMLPQGPPHKRLMTLAERHGHVLGLRLRGRQVVHVSGPRAVKHVLERKDLCARPRASKPEQNTGLLMGDGKWRMLAERFVETLDGPLKEAVICHAQQLVLSLEEKTTEEGDIDLLAISHAFALSLVWTLVAGGKDSEVSGWRLQEFGSASGGFVSRDNVDAENPLYPLLGTSLPVSELSEKASKLTEVVQRVIKEHRKQNHFDDPRDFIDFFLWVRPDLPQADQELEAACSALLVAGAEPLASLLSYCVSYLVQNPAMQRCLRDELKTELGHKKLPTRPADLQRLPYTRAVICEVLRHSGMMPFTAPHAAEQSTCLYGHRIPKGCLVLLNLWSVHHDQHEWHDPENFRPERFLKQDGTFRANENFIPFGMGSRRCPAESIAMHTCASFVAALVQNFELGPAERGPAPTQNHIPGVTTSPTFFFVAITRVDKQPEPQEDLDEKTPEEDQCKKNSSKSFNQQIPECTNKEETKESSCSKGIRQTPAATPQKKKSVTFENPVVNGIEEFDPDPVEHFSEDLASPGLPLSPKFAPYSFTNFREPNEQSTEEESHESVYGDEVVRPVDL